MSRSNLRDRFSLILVGLLVVLMPALVLIITLEVLFLFGEIDLTNLTLLELAELYLVEVVLLALFAVAVYRLTLRTTTGQLPDVLDRLDDSGSDGSEDRDGRTASDAVRDTDEETGRATTDEGDGPG